jgi:hypothetical protein
MNSEQTAEKAQRLLNQSRNCSNHSEVQVLAGIGHAILALTLAIQERGAQKGKKRVRRRKAYEESEVHDG